MWLLHTETGRLHHFHTAKHVRYAILSHVWQAKEQSFQDIQALGSLDVPLAHVSEKIHQSCRVAAGDGFEWLWIDTCCIDKSSSSELSEAINSMYAWYANAAICYAYLYDVHDEYSTWTAFRGSMWFARGWTLQELIAPMNVVFLSSNWCLIGTKQAFANLIEEITGIDREVLTLTRSLDEVSVARRMSWAAGRETTREEDRAYSLMGIFGVHMPTIYGEGGNAFLRLQQEILRRSPDQTIFAWGPSIVCGHDTDFVVQGEDVPLSGMPRALLASSPADFLGCGEISPIRHKLLAEELGLSSIKLPEYRFTSYGLRTELPIVLVDADSSGLPPVPPCPYLAFLACHNAEGATVALFLRSQSDADGQFFVGAPMGSRGYCRTGFLHQAYKQLLSQRTVVADVLLHSFDPYPTHGSRTLSVNSPSKGHPTFAFFFPRNVLLEWNGFFVDDTASMLSPNRDGYLLEVQWTWGRTTKSISFVANGGRSEIRTTVRISVGISQPSQSGSTNTTSPSSEHPVHFAVKLQEAPLETHSNVPSRVSASRPLNSTLSSVDWHLKPVVDVRHGCQCSGDRQHLPAQPTSTLLFGEDSSRQVALIFRLWENCHRSSATFAYLLDVRTNLDI